MQGTETLAKGPNPADSLSRLPATLAVGRRELVAMAIGSLLYAGLCWLTNVFPLQAAQDLQVRPGIVVPIMFGFMYGPVVGFVSGCVGNALGDLTSGLLPYPAALPTGNPIVDLARSYLLNWQVGNGIYGLIPGLAALSYRRYFSLRDQIRALFFVLLGTFVGMGFAAFTHPFVDPTVTMEVAFSQYFIPLLRINTANAAILVPILLFNYERWDLKSTDWLRSGLMRRFLLTILVSAALPIGLLGLFLTQQASGQRTNEDELMVKLGFTVLLSLVFTVANASLLAQSVSRPLLRLTGAARAMEAGQLSRRQAAELEAENGTDEVSCLSQMFGRMSQEVISREERLREQVEQLRIEIDESKKAKQVEEITGSDYFRDLQEKARQLREKRVDRQ